MKNLMLFSDLRSAHTILLSIFAAIQKII